MNPKTFRSHRSLVCLGATSVIGLLLTSCLSLPKTSELEIPSLKKKEVELTVDFETQIRPILESNCLACHNSTVAKRDLNLETLDTANHSWRGGPIIIPGSPERSRLHQITFPQGRLSDASTPHALDYEDRKLLHTWISEGAHWPEGATLAATASQ